MPPGGGGVHKKLYEQQQVASSWQLNFQVSDVAAGVRQRKREQSADSLKVHHPNEKKGAADVYTVSGSEEREPCERSSLK